MTTKTIEVFIAMNEDGDWEARSDSTDAAEALVDSYGYTAARIVKIKITMNAPEITEGGEVVIADEAGETIKAEAEAG